jgi:pimeloyl-ACP methyl ester carboxylesterase
LAAINLQPFECPSQDGSTLRGWKTDRPDRPVLFFLHGNGLCGRIYESFLAQFDPQFELILLDITGHGASDAVADFPGWNRIAELCTEALNRCCDASREVVVIGHSFGGILAILMAASAPGRFSNLMLLDPILFPRRMLMMFTLVKWLGLTERVHPMVRMTKKRRHQWATRDDALAYFKSRGAFARWDDLALTNYVQYGLKKGADNNVVLACDRSLEAEIFATWPRGLWRCVRAVSDPTHIIMGQDTYSFAKDAAATAQRVNQSIVTSHIEGDHFFMLEQPLETAQRVMAELRKSSD